MDKFAFAPVIDLPLAFITSVGFVLHFNAWARHMTSESNLDFTSRLSKARTRVFALIATILLVCWSVNFAFWFVLTLPILLGSMIAAVMDEASSGIELFSFAGYLVREWSFGFPQLILESPEDRHDARHEDAPKANVMGLRGVTVSPLRPIGEANIDGTVISVISDDGRLTDTGTHVIVSNVRNGRFCVRPLPEETP